MLDILQIVFKVIGDVSIPLFWIGFYRASGESTLIKVGEKGRNYSI